MFRDGHADVYPEAEKEFGLGMTTPREMARLCELLAEGKVVDRAVSDAMLAVLERQDEEKLADREGFKGDIGTDYSAAAFSIAAILVRAFSFAGSSSRDLR